LELELSACCTGCLIYVRNRKQRLFLKKKVYFLGEGFGVIFGQDLSFIKKIKKKSTVAGWKLQNQ
jgi:hypothetical protein